MKKQNKSKFIPFFLLPLLLSIVVVFAQIAQEVNLPDPGITPDSHLYSLDNWFEEHVELRFVSKEDMPRKSFEIAEEKLAEAYKMSYEKKDFYASFALDKYNDRVRTTELSIEQTNINNITKQSITNKLYWHVQVLKNIENKTPESAKFGLETAILKSSQVIKRKENQSISRCKEVVEDCLYYEQVNKEMQEQNRGITIPIPHR